MVDSNPKLPAVPTVALTALLLLAPCWAGAAPPRNAEPIALDAQSSELDLKNNNVFFRKVRIAQGPMSVTADQGQASRDALGRSSTTVSGSSAAT